MSKLFVAIAASLVLFGGTVSAQATRTIEMTVDGLVCAFCAQGIEKKLRKLDATDEVFVSLEHRIVAVSLKDGHEISDTTLRDLLTEAGYTLRGIRRGDEPLEAVRKRTHAS